MQFIARGDTFRLLKHAEAIERRIGKVKSTGSRYGTICTAMSLVLITVIKTSDSGDKISKKIIILDLNTVTAKPAQLPATPPQQQAPSTTARSTQTTARVSFFRRTGLSFLPAAAISAVALTLPILVGRRRRQFWQDEAAVSPPWPWHWLEEPDNVVREFTQHHRREMRRQDIATLGCKQLAYGPDESQLVLASHLLVCPSRRSRSLNLIFLNDNSRHPV